MLNKAMLDKPVDLAVGDIPILPGTKVELAEVGTATYDDVQDFANSFGSAGRKTGGVITAAGGNYIAVTGGTGYIRATDDDNAPLMSFDFPAPANLLIPTASVGSPITRFIGVEYNAGTPQVVAHTSYDWNFDTTFPLGMVVNEVLNGAESLHIVNNPWWVTDSIGNIIERLRVFGVLRDETVGGLILSATGTRNIAITGGTLWDNLNEFNFAAIDTAVAGTIEAYWYKAGSGWQDSDVTQFSVTEWNDVTQTTLQIIDNNKFCNIWLYAEIDDLKFSLIYPQAQYLSEALAEAVPAPSNLPSHIQQNGTLIGRFIIKQGVAVPVNTQSAFTTTFSVAAVTDHGNLTGLGDDDHTQYVLKVVGSSLVPDTEAAKIHVAGSDNQDLSGLVVKVVGSSLLPDTEAAKIHVAGSDDQDLSGLVVKVAGSSLVPDTEIAKIHSNTLDHSNALDHAAVTVAAPIALAGQALSLVNDVGGAVTEIDTGGLASSDLVIPTSKAARDYTDTTSLVWAIVFGG